MKRLSTKKWVVGIGSILMAIVLVLVGTLKNAETLKAEGIFGEVAELREKYWNNGQVFTILEIVPDGGVTEFAYLVGEEEPYSDGYFETETDFVNRPVEEQEQIVEDLADRGILTQDETARDDYPLHYSFKEFEDVVFSDQASQELIDSDYIEEYGEHLVAGSYIEIVDNDGNVSYEFTPKDGLTGADINMEATSAYLVKEDGTILYLSFDVASGTYKEVTQTDNQDPTVSDGNGSESGETNENEGDGSATEGSEGETVEGSAVVANSSVADIETGVIESSESVSSNDEQVNDEQVNNEQVNEEQEDEVPEETVPDVSENEPVTDEEPTEEPITTPEEPTSPEEPVQGEIIITATGDAYEGYGYLTGYKYTKTIKEYTVTNNEFFKKFVFDMSIDDRAKVHVDVKTVEVSKLTLGDIRSANLFYIQDGEYGVDGVSADIASNIAYELVKMVSCDPENDTSYATPRVPCIIDYSIYDNLNTTNQNSNMYKLAIMMMSSDMPATFDYFYNGIYHWDNDINSEGWNTIKSFMPSEIPNDGHFVNENVYFVDDIALVSSDFTKTFTENEVLTGFPEVYNAIAREKNDNPNCGFIDAGLINPAIVIQYLLNFADDSMIIKKSAIKVLELQPCKTFNWDTDAKKMNFIKKYAPGFENNPEAVEIECMTTMEFIGRNDNLNATYDLVYIGTNIDNYRREIVQVEVGEKSEWIEGHWEGRRWVDGYWKTTKMYDESSLRRWQDSNMKGMIYTHVGDLTENPDWGNNIHGDRGVGLLESDYDNAQTDQPGWRQLRFPGNDISSHNMEDLIEYLKSGYPVILSDMFFTYGGKNYTIYKEGSGTVVEGAVTGLNAGNSYTVNANNKKQLTEWSQQVNKTYSTYDDRSTTRYGILDTSTYLYKVIKEAWNPSNTSWEGRKYPNLVNESGADSQFMNVYLNKQKLTLNLTQMPTSYSYTTQGEYDVIKDIKYLTQTADGKYILNYEFAISNLDSLSSPNDKYTCKLFIDDNFDGKFSKTQEEVTELVVVEAATGKTVATNDLRAGVPYTVTRQLPADYVGCIQWQLLISLNSNPYIQCEETGLTAVKSVKETINILHIMDYNGNSVNLEDELIKGTSVWGQTLKNVPDFDINIKSITVREYVELLERYLWPKVAYGQDIRVYPTPEDFFTEGVFDNGGTDMILMGFVDCFEELNHDVAVNAIMNYASSGRSVLFSHDMTSWKNKYREKTGTERMFYKNADGSLGRVTGANEFKGYQGSQYFNIRIREMSGMDMYGATVNRYKGTSYANTGQGYSNDPTRSNYNMDAWNYLVGLGKDMAFKANTEQRETVGDTTGPTYIELREGSPPYIFDNGGNRYGGYMFDNNNDDTLITKVNDGVITSYPYELPDKFTSATTHSQYYALDMEEDADDDGESDLVVWYCVAARESDANYTTDDLYSVSPNDVRNNYYIYSMGNIIYTGMGHTIINDNIDHLYVDEIKLFINTMVAAYRAGVKTPEVTVIESDDEGADRIDFIALPYDTALFDSTTGSYEDAGIVNSKKVDVYFTVNDNNVIKGTKKLVSEFYVNGTEVAFDNYELYNCTDNRDGAEIIDMGNNQRYYALESGKKYRVTLTLDYASQIAKSCEVQVDVYARVEKKNGAINTSEKAYDKVRVGKVDMFDLD